MDGLYQRGRTWWIRFTPAPGAKQERYSTGETDESQAILVAREIMERASSQARETAGSCMAEVTAYIAAKRKAGLAPATLSSREYVLKGFIGEIDAARPGQISRQAIERWFDARRAKHEHTAVAYLSQVQGWFKWLLGQGKIAINPAAQIKLPKVVMRQRRSFLMPDQAKALITTCTDPGLKFALYCALHAGLRKNEIVEARPSWFDLGAGLLHIQATDTFQPKTREARTIPLTKEFRAWLQNDYGLPSPFMIAPKAQHGSYRYRYDFRKAFDALVTRLGYDVTFHDLRRTFASLHVSRGTSIYKVAKWLGDTVEVVEDTYGHLIPQDAQIDAAWE